MSHRICLLGLALSLLAQQLIGSTPLASAQDPSTRPVDGIRNLGIETIALEHAKVIPHAGKVIESATILIRDGKIVAIGPKVQVPAGAKRYDLHGKIIYPGWIDPYVEVEVPMPDATKGAPYWNANVVPQRHTADSYQPSTDQWLKHRKAGITSVLAVPSGGIIRGSSALVTTLEQPAEKSIIQPLVADHLRLTVSFGARGGGYPTSPMGAVSLARQAFLDAEWYRKAWQAYRSQPSLPQPERNAALQALVDLTNSQRPIMVDTSNEQFALRADQFAREMGLRIMLHGSGREYRLVDRIAGLNRPIILPVNFPKAPNVSTPELAFNVPLQDLMHWELAPENPARLIAAGAQIAITSEGLEDPSELRAQLRTAIERGLSPEDALNAVTANPAKWLGVDHLIGSIELGKWADLLICDGEIFAEKTKIEETWVHGTRHLWKEPASPAIDGTWELTLSPQEKKPTSLLLTLDSQKKLTGSLQLPDEALADSNSKSPNTQHPDRASTEQPPNPLDATPPSPSTPTTPPTPDTPTAPDPKTTPSPNNDEPKPNTPDSQDPKPKSTPPVIKASLDKLTLADARLAANFRPDSLLPKKRADSTKPSRPPSVNPSSESPTSQPPAKEPSQSPPTPTEESQPPYELSGIAQLSLVFLEDQPNTEGIAQGKWIGSITWADGSRSSIQGARTKASDTTKEKTHTQPASEKPASDKPSSQQNSAPNPDQNAAAAPSTSTAQSTPTAKKEKSDPQPTLSSPNYPLGEFGRLGLPEQSEWLLIKNAKLWTSGPAGTLENSDMLVHRGIIEQIGQAIVPPENAVVLDMNGKQITPGIIDCHSHMATDSGVNEAGQAVTAEVRIGDLVDATDYTIYCQLAGGVTTANILHGSANPIGGQNQVIKLRWGGIYDDLKMKEAPAGIKFALGENVKQSSRPEPSDRYPQSRMGVEQLFRDRFEAALEYDKQWKSWNRDAIGLPPRRDLELETISEILRGERWIHCHSYRQDEILALLRVLEEYHITIGSLQHILEGYKVAEAMAKHGATGSSFSDWWAYKYEVIDAIPYNGALMHNMGIVVSFNSDDHELGRHLNHEAAKAVKYGGVPPDQALQFVTLNPAKQLRIDRWVGSLEVGKQADFVVWNGSPLSAMSRCEQTWIDGRKYFDRELDLAERTRVATLHRQLVQKVLESDTPMAKAGERPLDPAALWPRYDEFCHHHHDDDHDEQLHDHHHNEQDHDQE